MHPPYRPKNNSPYLLISLLPMLLALPGGASATAALDDWASAGFTGQCRGQYIQPDPGPIQDNRTRATADRLTHNTDQSSSLEGDVRISRGDQHLMADLASFDSTTETYNAEGNVRLRQPGLLVKGESISGNLAAGTVSVDDASFLLHRNRVRGTATRIHRDNTNNLHLDAGQFTTCEPGDNTWVVRSETVNFKPDEGYGVARNITLRIKDVPVAWSPYLRFPIDDTRQSGFLMPGIGQDKDGGLEIALPYYFNLREDYDAVYTLRSIWQRGFMHEGELRYLSDYGMNTLAVAWLPSDDEYDAHRQVLSGNPASLDEQDRWLANINHRGRRGGWSSGINYTAVSDVDYFDDFGGFIGAAPGSDLRRSPALLRTGFLTYATESWRSSLELRSFQALTRARQPEYEVLPRFSLAGNHALGQVDTAGLVQFTRFDNSSTTDPTGSRLVVDAQAALPLRQPWGFFTPTIGVLHRDYSLDNVPAGSGDNPDITTITAAMDTGLTFARRTDFAGADLLQTLEPRLHYLYVEYKSQSHLPVFDSTRLTPSYDNIHRENRYTGYDRVGDANRFAFRLSTSVSSMATGQHFLTAGIGRIFHLDNRKVNFQLPAGVNPRDDTSPLFMDLSASIGNLYFNTFYAFDTGDNRSSRGFAGIRYRGEQGHVLNFNYAMTERSVQRASSTRNEEETDVSFLVPVNDRWRILGRWRFGWDNRQTIESLVGVEYNSCCWQARIVFRRNLEESRLVVFTTPGQAPQLMSDRRADSGIYFEFQLKGLGALGGRLDSLLQNSIPGYWTNR